MTTTAVFEEKIIWPIAVKNTCQHCGDTCPTKPILLAEKTFCCEGCKTVFEILHSNGLSQFYQIERGAGVSQKNKRQEQYAWLDDPEAVEKLLDFTDGKTTRITFQLPQIHCASCVWLLENLYKLCPGVHSSKVNFLKKEAYVTFSSQTTSLRKIVELLSSIGYAPSLNLGSLEQKANKTLSRHLIFQLGVAGFAFGNIMLLSFPEYLGLTGAEAWFRQLFGYLNIALATPVAFYSGRDYLRSGWHSLRTWNPCIDIPLALGIVVLYFRSAFEILTDTGAGYMDSLAGLVFFLLIGKWFQQITYHRISFERDYKSYFPIAATRIKSTSQHETTEDSIPISKLEIGDAILVRHSEIIPSDSILKKGNARIDYSFVTGEAEPVDREVGEKIYAGGRQMGDAIELLLTKKVSHSYLTQLWNEDAFQQDKLSGASKLANKVSRYFTVIILLIAFTTLAYWLPKDARTAFNAFTAVLIIACPCAAALNVPFTLGNAVRILGRRGFYLKNTNVVEALRIVTAVVFDKTGTLTHASGSELHYEGEQLTTAEKSWVRALARQSSHPVSRQLAEHFSNDGMSPSHFAIKDFQEFTGKGLSGKLAGHSIKIGSNTFIHPSEAILDGSVFIEIDGVAKGSFRLQNRYRTGAWDVLNWFRPNAKTYLLSGDNERERAFLAEKFYATKSANVFFHQSPIDKLEFIKDLQARGEKVLMLGDGLNDAGALRQANVGIVIAEDANNFTPACDAILDAKQFKRLPQFLDFAKGSIQLLYAAWGLAALYNVVGLGYAVQGLLSPVVAAILMPASAVTIVLFGFVSTTIAGKHLTIKH